MMMMMINPPIPSFIYHSVLRGLKHANKPPPLFDFFFFTAEFERDNGEGPNTRTAG